MAMWIGWFIPSCCFLLAGIAAFSVSMKIKSEKSEWRPMHFLALGVILSALCLFTPIYWIRLSELASGASRVLATIGSAIHHTIRLFIVDSEFDFVTESTVGLPTAMKFAYRILGGALFLIAPILTFGFLATFFKKFFAWLKFFSKRGTKPVYAFSELNEASIQLAESIRADKTDKKSATGVIVFTDIYDFGDEKSGELLDRANKIKAILLRKDISEISWRRPSAQSVNLFLIGESDDENMSQYAKLYYDEKLKQEKNITIFLFSMSAQSDLMLRSQQADHDAETKRAKEEKREPVESSSILVRRINEADSLVYNYLYNNGEEVFGLSDPLGAKDKKDDDKIIFSKTPDGKKIISAVIVGLGKYGTAMLKALIWYCQMDGYYLKITVIDEDKKAATRFALQCPDLMDAGTGCKTCNEEGDSQYEIKILSGVDVKTSAFAEELAKITDVTFAISCLGDDEANIQCAMTMSRVFAGMRKQAPNGSWKPTVRPLIKAIVRYDKADIDKAGNHYKIELFGNIATLYSKEVIFNAALEEKGLARHTKWYDAPSFWRNEYNRRSSCASYLHCRARRIVGIPGADKKVSELSPEEKETIQILEHKRWNAFVRTEGYTWSGSTDKSSRDDRAKLHNYIVSYQKLPPNIKENDLVTEAEF